MRYIICYDISSDKRRNKTAQLLEKFGIRIQESVFEAVMPLVVRDKLINLISKITTKADKVRLYPICRECYSKTIEIGIKEKRMFDKGFEIF